MIHGLLMAAAIDAADPTDADVKERAPAPETFGRAGSVVLGDVVAARGGLGFNGPGIAGRQVSVGWLAFGSTNEEGGSSRTIQAEPSFDVFVGHGVSLGAIAGAGVGRWEYNGGAPATDVWFAKAMPRVGDVITLTDDIAMWPRFGIGVVLGDGSGQPRMVTTLNATFDLPFMFRIARHVALQAGPHVTYFGQVAGGDDAHGLDGGASAGVSIVL